MNYKTNKIPNDKDLFLNNTDDEDAFDDINDNYFQNEINNFEEMIYNNSLRFLEMNDAEKNNFLKNIKNFGYEFTKSPFSHETLQLLFSNQNIDDAYIIAVSNVIVDKFPSDFAFLANLGLINLCNIIINQKICLPITCSTFDILYISVMKAPEAAQIIYSSGYLPNWIKIIVNKDEFSFPGKVYDLSGSTIPNFLNFDEKDEIFCYGARFLIEIFPKLPNEFETEELINPGIVLEVLKILANKVSNLQQIRKNEEKFEDDIPNSFKALKNEIKGMINIILKLILVFTQKNTPLVSNVFSMNNYHSIPFLFYLIESRRIKRNFAVLASIISLLLNFDFNSHYPTLSNFGLEDFVLIFLRKAEKLTSDCINIIIRILVNIPNKDIFNESLIQNMRKHLDISYEVKYPLCIALSQLTIGGNEFIMDKLFRQMNILSDIFDCILDSDEDDALILMKGVNNLINYAISHGLENEAKEQLGNYDVDDLDVESDNPEILQLKESLANFITCE